MAVSKFNLAVLTIGLIGSLVVFTLGARNGTLWLCSTGAALGALALGSYSIAFNASFARADSYQPDVRYIGARMNAWLTSAAFGWGGLALLFGYGLSDLKWRHDWQYGFGMVLVAALVAWLGRRFMTVNNQAYRSVLLGAAYRATQLQLAGAVAGLTFLIGAGKLASSKDDWAANQIFLFGGLLIILLSIVALITHRRLVQS